MTRSEAIDWQEKLLGDFGGERDPIMLPEICLWVRAAANGSADPWPKAHTREVLGMLQARLDTWEDGVAKGKRLDDTVKEMLSATIAEVLGYLEEVA